MSALEGRPSDYERNVFINCPFDPPFQPIFQAIVFTIEDCGFLARCALEIEDSGEVRANKIIRIIKECALGIHDISRTESNAEGLPRFNMPYELGLFIGCREFGGGRHKNKKTLVLDRERHRYAKYISDIAGQDIQDHANQAPHVIRKIRNWLASHSHTKHFPGGEFVMQRFLQFSLDLPEVCIDLHLTATDLDNYRDFHNAVTEWLSENPR